MTFDGSRQKAILVVDDDAIQPFEKNESLEKAGYRVVSTASGEETVEGRNRREFQRGASRAMSAERTRATRDLSLDSAAALLDTEDPWYSDFFELSPIGCLVLSPSGFIRIHNEMASRIMGMPHAKLAGWRLKTLVADSDIPVFNAFWGNVALGKRKDGCDVALADRGPEKRFIHIEATFSERTKDCMCVVVDSTAGAMMSERLIGFLQEKELLLAEVHHRIKNNMGSMAALLSLQAESLVDPMAAAILRDAVRRIESMGILYDKLYRSDDVGAISVKEYVPDLVASISRSFLGISAVSIKTRIEDIRMNSSVLFPLGIIINEIVANALKYAFIERSEGTIVVSVSRRDSVTLVVIRDNGIGIPDTVSGDKTAGFGMRLVFALVKQIHGSMNIIKTKGTKYVIRMQQ